MPPVAGVDELPPWPEDEWGRWLSPRGLSRGPMWVRPAHAAERSPAIETISGRRALDLLESWIFDEGERAFVHRLHTRLCRLSAHLDAASRWEQVTRELRSAFEHGRVVVQRPVERGGAPGTIPIEPPAPLVEATEAEISAAREGRHALAVAEGSTSDLVGWVRGAGPGRPLYTLDLVPVPMAPPLQKQLARLSTMELSGYIGWWGKQKAPPRKPAKDLAGFVRKSSDLRHQWAVASGDVLTQILARWK